MVIEKQTFNTYHENGQLAYTETIGTLYKHTEHLYSNSRIAKDGTQWIRIGLNAKYDRYGRCIWSLYYNEDGKIEPNKSANTNESNPNQTGQLSLL